MKLVTAEKPSVAMSIAKVIGARRRKDDYVEGYKKLAKNRKFNSLKVSFCGFMTFPK